MAGGANGASVIAALIFGGVILAMAASVLSGSESAEGASAPMNVATKPVTALGAAEVSVAEAPPGPLKEFSEADAVQADQELVYEVASVSLRKLKNTLQDPYSVEFRDVWAVRAPVNGTEVIGVCGVMNAKDAFGAYTGETMFVHVGSLWTPEQNGFAGVFQQFCVDGEKVLQIHRP